jgi:hypothetical protein
MIWSTSRGEALAADVPADFTGRSVTDRKHYEDDESRPEVTRHCPLAGGDSCRGHGRA